MIKCIPSRTKRVTSSSPPSELNPASSVYYILFYCPCSLILHWIFPSSSAFNAPACSFASPPTSTTPLPNLSFQHPSPLLPPSLSISWKLCFAIFFFLFLFLRFLFMTRYLFPLSALPLSLLLSVLVCMSWLGRLWILSCNRQCAALVSDVCMTCFPPDPISCSQPACLPFLG